MLNHCVTSADYYSIRFGLQQYAYTLALCQSLGRQHLYVTACKDLQTPRELEELYDVYFQASQLIPSVEALPSYSSFLPALKVHIPYCTLCSVQMVGCNYGVIPSALSALQLIDVLLQNGVCGLHQGMCIEHRLSDNCLIDVNCHVFIVCQAQIV